MRYKLSKYSHLLKLNSKYYCLLHSINQELVFCDKLIKNSLELMESPRELKYIEKNIGDRMLFQFLKNKFLVPENSNEKVCDQKINLNNSGFKLLRILLTDLCNLNCKYCKVKNNTKNKVCGSTSVKYLKKIIKFFLNNSNLSEPKTIQITGGEPLLYWKKIKEIVSILNKYKRVGEKCIVVLSTNGLLLTEEMNKFILDNNIKVIISLDGDKFSNNKLRFRNREQYSRIKNNIVALKNLGVELGVSMVIGRHNYNDLNRIISNFLDNYQPVSLGVNFMKPPSTKGCGFSYLIEPSKYVNAVYSSYKKFRDEGLFFELIYRKISPFVFKRFRFYDCGASEGTTINIDAEGDLGPCKSFLVMKMNYLEKSDRLIKNRIDGIIKTFRKNSPIFYPKCEKCSAIAMCGNGCAYSALAINKKLFSIDEKACAYSRFFQKQIINDLLNLIDSKFNRHYYIPDSNDRRKLLGKINIDKLSLKSSVGHET